MSDPASETTKFTPYRQGYAAGYRNEPMAMPDDLDAKHWKAWSGGYLLGQRDAPNDAMMDKWEATDAKA